MPKKSLESISTLFMNVSDSGLVPLNILMDLAPAPHKTFNKSLSVFNSPFTPLSPSSLRLYLLFIYPFFTAFSCSAAFSSRLFFLLFIHISSLFLFILLIYILIFKLFLKPKQNVAKNWPVKGLRGRCLSEFIDWRYSQSCWYFRLCFVNCCPSNLLSGSTSLCQSTVYTDCVWLGGSGKCWVLLDIIFCRSLTFCIWPDSEPTKLLDRPKQKLRRGGGLRLIHNTPAAKSVYRSTFLDDDILFWCLYS